MDTLSTTVCKGRRANQELSIQLATQLAPHMRPKSTPVLGREEKGTVVVGAHLNDRGRRSSRRHGECSRDHSVRLLGEQRNSTLWLWLPWLCGGVGWEAAGGGPRAPQRHGGGPHAPSAGRRSPQHSKGKDKVESREEEK